MSAEQQIHLSSSQRNIDDINIEDIDKNSKNPDEAIRHIKNEIRSGANIKNSSQIIKNTENVINSTTDTNKRSEDRDFWVSDLHAISYRNETYGQYLKDYCFNFNKKSSSQRRLRRCFFWITMGLLSLIVLGGITGIGFIFYRGNIGVGEVASVISALAGMITAFLVLPKIIGDNLFPKQEDDKSAALFTTVLEKDLQLRQFYQQDKVIRDIGENVFGENASNENDEK